MKKSVRNLKRQTMSTEPVASEVRRSKRLKVGEVPSLAREHKSGWRRTHEDLEVTEKTSGTNLTSDEEDALINQYRHYLGYENIVGLGVEQQTANEKLRDVLVFLVIEKKNDGELSKSEKIPKKVWLDVKNGRRMEIDTVVEETGEIVPQVAEGGDAVCAVCTGCAACAVCAVRTACAKCAVAQRDHVMEYCTIGAIMPFPKNDSPIRLLTSAHLIDYEERHKGKMLHYLTRERYRRVPEENLDESFLEAEQSLSRIANFVAVEKHERKLTGPELDNVERNEQDVLWAELYGHGTRPIAGRRPVGIRAPRKGEHFNMYGIKSGMHREKILSTNFEFRVSHRDGDGRVYYTYWKNIIKYKLEHPTEQGDSGAALMSDDDYVIGLHSFGGEIDGKNGFACRLQKRQPMTVR